MRKFVINADYGNGSSGPVTIYIGESENNHHPIHFQADILFKHKGISITSDVMDALTELREIAIKNQVLLEDLCVYAIGNNNTTYKDNNISSDSLKETINKLQPENSSNETEVNDSSTDDSLENNNKEE